jgi:bifunctional DNA-binding transcriptional regulator/antitoxin component of YhaV-PrlF toxin-antitoxin module
MTLNYNRVWKTLNELESVSSKICSARAILDSAIVSLESGNREKTETLMYAVDEYLQYYLEEFDRKFKDAWDETVTKLKQEEADDYMRPWGHSDMEALSSYYPLQSDDLIIGNEPRDYYENVAPSATQRDIDKVVKWQLPVEEDTVNGEYFITFPDDLLEAANLKEGDDVEWIDNDDGTFILKKSVKQLNHDEAIAAGWTMTADGFWVKEKCEKQLNDDEAIAAGWKKDIDGTWIFRVH